MDLLDPAQFWARIHAALGEIADEDRMPPPQAKAAAVLVLLEESPDGFSVVLTRRRRDMRSHPGQIAFPGGRIDPGETIEQAALREAHEEVGLRADSVEVVGTGPVLYLPPSRFWVAPVIASWRGPHPLTVNPAEVDDVLHVPLAHLLDPARWRYTPGAERDAGWAWQLDDDLLWGATAIMVASLLDTAVGAWHPDVISPFDLGEEQQVRPWEYAELPARRQRLGADVPAAAQSTVPHVSGATVQQLRAWMDEHGVGPQTRAQAAGRALTAVVRSWRGGGALSDGALSDGALGDGALSDGALGDGAGAGRSGGGDASGDRGGDGGDVSGDRGVGAGRGVAVLAGPSVNGAGGLAAARLLREAGVEVAVQLVGKPRYPALVEAAQAAGASVRDFDVKLDTAGAIVIDAILGIGAIPPIADAPRKVARWLRRFDVPVVSLDVPSGLHPDKGAIGECVTADVTVAMGVPTLALRQPVGQVFAGDQYVADLGVPAEAWVAIGLAEPGLDFSGGPLVRLVR